MTDLTRRAVYALPAAGILTLVPWVFILQEPDAKSDPEGFARAVTSSTHFIGGYMYVIGFACLLLGLFALYGYLARTGASGWAAAGLVATMVVTALTLMTIGTLVLGASVLGDAYRSGDHGVSSGLVLMSGESWRIMKSIQIAATLSPIGSVAFAVAVWKSGTLPKVAGILLVPGIFASMSLSPIVGWAGAVLLVVSGFWLARRVSHGGAGEPSAAKPDGMLGGVVKDA